MFLFLSFQASFIPNTAKRDIDVDDPDFWTKWAQKAAIDVKDVDVRPAVYIDFAILFIERIIATCEERFVKLRFHFPDVYRPHMV